jgi:hypothetical protein
MAWDDLRLMLPEERLWRAGRRRQRAPELLYASHLVFYDQNVEMARHERLIAKDRCRLELDHYLEALIRKPGAFPGPPCSNKRDLQERSTASRVAPGP